MSWKFIGSCADGEHFEIEGIQVWSCEWVRDEGEFAAIRDPHYNQAFDFPVYQFVHGRRRLRVAAGEFSNCIWGFYLPV